MSANTPGRNRGRYDPESVQRYWSRRLDKVDSLAAVLTYDAPPAANRAYDRWERESLTRLLPRSLRNKHALDLGCGTGRITLLLARLGAEVVAVDLSPAMLHHSRRKAQRLGLSSKVTFLHSLAQQLPIPDRSFDVITCFGLLEHLPARQRRQCLAEAARVLKPAGRIYLVVNNKENRTLQRRWQGAQQPRAGYHSTLIGLDWLRRTSEKLGLKAVLRAANPHYGLVHYHLLPQGHRLALSARDIATLFRLATDLDFGQPLSESPWRQLASHLLLELTGQA